MDSCEFTGAAPNSGPTAFLRPRRMLFLPPISHVWTVLQQTTSFIPMERRVLKRRRPALSCISCRRRKIKCDRNSPCGQCVAISTQCAFQQFDNQPSSPAPPSPRPQSQFVLATPPSQASQEQQVDPEVQAAAAEIGHIVGPLGVPSPHGIGEFVTEARVEQSHEEPQRTYNVADSLSETGRNLLARQNGPGATDVVLNKTRILRWSNWVGAAKEVRPEALSDAH